MTMPSPPAQQIVERLASRAGKTEQDIQSDVRALLLFGGLELEADDLIEVTLEAQVGGGKRIDVEAGYTVIEVKKSLATPEARADAAEQLAGYVRARTEQTGQRYVGVLTDGVSWHLHRLDLDGELQLVSTFTLRGEVFDPDGLAVWLEGVLATREQIRPTPLEVERRLGSKSSSFELDLADLRAVYQAHRGEPDIQLKRELWARLLTAALGTTFEDSDELFIVHTYLVIVAELIAHAVVGISLADPQHTGRSLVSGQAFHQAQIGGVVEEDFFDWPVDTPAGERLVRTVARRLSRFTWAAVDHDVLKVLYESVIDPDTRHRLGEYYTPDWLAQRIVEETVSDPLGERVLDPACGSGTFLFWAARRFLTAADDAGVRTAEAIRGLTEHVFGIDLHPVAVTLARVTYLLAIGTERLADRDAFTVPVYLGDSVRWAQDESLFSAGGILVYTTDGAELFARELRFPERVVEDAGRFDPLVGELADRAAAREPGSPIPPITAILNRNNVAEEDRDAVRATFQHLCQLHDDGRDHIWGYYIRNLARPFWFTRHPVDVLLGNPPWLAYRFMPARIQEAFRQLSRERALWAGAKVATHQDLSGLFVARAVEQYLRSGGRFAFVMPAATLSRLQFHGFRAAEWSSPSGQNTVRLDQPWDLTNVEPTIFPVPCSVVFGARAAASIPMPTSALAWVGRLPDHARDWGEAAELLSTQERDVVAAVDAPQSPYESQFTQGATIVPTVLVRVEPGSASPLGVPAGTRAVQSARTGQEKNPWKALPSLEGVVESRFIYPMHLGSTIAPYRALEPTMALVPWLGDRLMDGNDDRLDEFPGLGTWWRRAEQRWEQHKPPSSKLTLRDRLDYQRGMTGQFPLSPHRVVYTTAGTRLAAARLEDSPAVIESTLYWAPVSGPEEGRYLCAILNSHALGELVTPLQSQGQFGPRHFHKYVFAVPFPLYDASDEIHRELALAGARAEEVAAATELEPTWGFQKARKVIRRALEDHGIASTIEDLVGDLLAQAA